MAVWLQWRSRWASNSVPRRATPCNGVGWVGVLMSGRWLLPGLGSKRRWAGGPGSPARQPQVVCVCVFLASRGCHCKELG